MRDLISANMRLFRTTKDFCFYPFGGDLPNRAAYYFGAIDSPS